MVLGFLVEKNLPTRAERVFFHNFGSLDPSSLSFPYQPEKTHQSLMDGNGGWKPLPK